MFAVVVAVFCFLFFVLFWVFFNLLSTLGVRDANEMDNKNKKQI